MLSYMYFIAALLFATATQGFRQLELDDSHVDSPKFTEMETEDTEMETSDEPTTPDPPKVTEKKTENTEMESPFTSDEPTTPDPPKVTEKETENTKMESPFTSDEPTTPDPPKVTEMETEVTVMESPSNVTFAEAVRELSVRHRVSAMHNLYGTNLYGGGGGGWFLDYQTSADISCIVIRSGSLIDSIQLYYRRHWSTFAGPHHGGHGGGRSTYYLARGEYVRTISGKTGSLVDSLSFTTNYGRVLGPKGGRGGGSFYVRHCHLRGIYGRSGTLLDAIGFICSH